MKLSTKLTLPICALALMLFAPLSQALAGGTTVPTCTPTTFTNSGQYPALTALLVNPGTVTGDVDATGCDIGVYYGHTSNGQVSNANVHGAKYYGIVNNGGNVDVENSTVSDIGDTPFGGAQHGIGIYFASGSAAQGNILSNLVWSYQKAGISVRGPSASASIQSNTVLGLGPVDFIAQNGIEVGFGATVDVGLNFVYGNSYTGANEASSAGILLFGGLCYGGAHQINTKVHHNTAVENDVGVEFSNLNATCNPTENQTFDLANNNTLVNNELNNTTGNSPTQGYQAGISDSGNSDTIENNSICGLGYTPPGTSAIAVFEIDTTFTTNATVQGNTFCGAASNALPAAPVAGAARRLIASP